MATDRRTVGDFHGNGSHLDRPGWTADQRRLPRWAWSARMDLGLYSTVQATYLHNATLENGSLSLGKVVSGPPVSGLFRSKPDVHIRVIDALHAGSRRIVG
jgi:hypothetical protein